MVCVCVMVCVCERESECVRMRESVLWCVCVECVFQKRHTFPERVCANARDSVLQCVCVCVCMFQDRQTFSMCIHARFCHREKLNEAINVIVDSKIEEKTKQNPFVRKINFFKKYQNLRKPNLYVIF